MNKTWSKTEISEIIADYFHMLSYEIKQLPYNKTEHRRSLKKRLNNRSDGSIEFKHQNISAILIKYGRPYIIGYKPRANYQKDLEKALLDFLEFDKGLEKDFEAFSLLSKFEKKLKIDFETWIRDKPEMNIIEEPKTEYKTKIARINYIEKEQTNKLMGEQGESLVIEYEKWRLKKEGKEKLANGIEWVSKEYGDGAGFDILSKNINGTDRYIEVKTTKLGKYTPIYFTRNELKFSKKNSENFHLYRVFEFNRNPKMFNLLGSLDEVCKSEPINYIGKFK